ncbi:MAG: hypothetical protein A3E82_08315 [Gammaproteobacteria bacterium RIFCSPHIGHO2_12_FULL_38_11]|nr:MAG: hypothetical protein A3E82_08315 [Gammaproteobacteria bacterium RIFCSPHIGHO2_12_FULL_38_11]
MNLIKNIILSLLLCVFNSAFSAVFIKNINCTDPAIAYYYPNSIVQSQPIKPPVILQSNNNKKSAIHPVTTIAPIAYHPPRNYIVSVIGAGAASIFLPVNEFYLMSGSTKQYCSGGTPNGSSTITLVNNTPSDPTRCECE